MFALYSLVLCVAVVLVTGFYLIYRDIRRLEEEIIEFSAHAHGVMAGRQVSDAETCVKEAAGGSGDEGEVKCSRDSAEAAECQETDAPQQNHESDDAAPDADAVEQRESGAPTSEANEVQSTDVVDAEKGDGASIDGGPAV